MIMETLGLISLGNWFTWDGKPFTLEPGNMPLNWRRGLDERIKPIPLTPQILRDVCGFEEVETITDSYNYNGFGGYKIFSNDGEYILQSPEGAFSFVRMYYSDTDYGDQYELVNGPLYIHTLQNLYQILTGKPLPIDETALRASTNDAL